MASHGIKLFLLLTTCCIALPLKSWQLQEGDLLFCCSDTANAITAVTSGEEGLPIDHVAIVLSTNSSDDSFIVIEAVKPAVCITPMDTFLCHNQGMVLVGRVVGDLDVTESLLRCKQLVGKPYDDLYLPGDSAIYCSELVQMNYVNTAGELIFVPVPMSFHDGTGHVTEHWTEFYANRGLQVPEGAPGSNPGELSRRPQISIIGTLERKTQKTAY